MGYLILTHTHMDIWINDNDRTLFSPTLESWELDSGNHPQMAWIQVSELLSFAQGYNMEKYG